MHSPLLQLLVAIVATVECTTDGRRFSGGGALTASPRVPPLNSLVPFFGISNSSNKFLSQHQRMIHQIFPHALHAPTLDFRKDSSATEHDKSISIKKSSATEHDKSISIKDSSATEHDKSISIHSQPENNVQELVHGRERSDPAAELQSMKFSKRGAIGWTHSNWMPHSIMSGQRKTELRTLSSDVLAEKALDQIVYGPSYFLKSGKGLECVPGNMSRCKSHSINTFNFQPHRMGSGGGELYYESSKTFGGAGCAFWSIFNGKLKGIKFKFRINMTYSKNTFRTMQHVVRRRRDNQITDYLQRERYLNNNYYKLKHDISSFKNVSLTQKRGNNIGANGPQSVGQLGIQEITFNEEIVSTVKESDDKKTSNRTKMLTDSLADGHAPFILSNPSKNNLTKIEHKHKSKEGEFAGETHLPSPGQRTEPSSVFPLQNNSYSPIKVSMKPTPASGSTKASPIISAVGAVPKVPALSESPRRCSRCPNFLRSPTTVEAAQGMAANLTCGVRWLGSRQVSWIRRKDLHVLSTGTFTYTNDDRFSIVHGPGSPYWTLSIADTRQSDTGIYECQVPAQPKMFKRFWLNVIVPHATIAGRREVFMQAGGDLKLACHVTGGTPPTYIQWYHSSAQDSTAQKVNPATRGGMELVSDHRQGLSWIVLAGVNRTDAGLYTCRPDRALSAAVTVHVLQEEAPAAMQKGKSDQSNASVAQQPTLPNSPWSSRAAPSCLLDQWQNLLPLLTASATLHCFFYFSYYLDHPTATCVLSASLYSLGSALALFALTPSAAQLWQLSALLVGAVIRSGDGLHMSLCRVPPDIR